MKSKPKILAFAGSLRKGSFNKILAKIAAKSAEAAGGEVNYINLFDYPVPPYNADDEEKSGLPENAKKLKKLMIAHNGFLISSPEYNSGISGVLKNVIDWVSRPEKEDPVSLVAFRGKVAALMSASPGALGGLRGLVHVRLILGNIYTLVLPKQVTIPKAYEAFDDSGAFKDPKNQDKVDNLTKKLVDVTRKLRNCQ